MAAALSGLLAPAALAGYIVDLEDLGLAPGSFSNGADRAGGFSSHGTWFGNEFDDASGYVYWSGFAASAVNAPLLGGYENQYASAAGGGAGGSLTYAVGYDDPYGPQQDILTLPSSAIVAGLFVNNTAYAAWSMREGDGFAKAFGGADGSDPDWFRLSIGGVDPGGDPLGAVEVYLADFRAEDPAGDYILTEWTWVDLSGLGGPVAGLTFSLASSDVGAFGMNTPAYFAIDDVVVVPEPSVLALLAAGSAIGRARRRRRSS